MTCTVNDDQKNEDRTGSIESAMEFLSGWKMTAISGISLILGFALSYAGLEMIYGPVWITIAVSGAPLVYRAAEKIAHGSGIGKISSEMLVTIAMTAAILIGDVFAAGEIAFIMAIGEMLEDMTVNRAKKGLRKLIGIVPAMGRRVTDGREEMVPIEEISENDIIRILPGETVPVDGIILAGETSIDQSVMTGESLPVDKEAGDEVFCGTINHFGAIDVRTSRAGEDSSLRKMIEMIKEAEEKQAPIQRIVDKWAGWLVPAAMIVAVLSGIFTNNIVTAVTILVVFCPCALVLATPTAIVAAIGQATGHGIVVKSGESLEKMGATDTVMFDKTGTITYGKLNVSDVVSLSPQMDETALLALAASAESRSEHPLGKAITARAKKTNIPLTDPETFRMDAGKGIRARIDGKEILCGNERYISENGICLTENISEILTGFRAQGKASVIVAADGVCSGVIALSDTLRPDAAEMIAELKTMNITPIILTGDNKETAEHFAKAVGITEVRAELLPDQKVEAIRSLQREGKKVCMIGDGVNDAPALKTADVGIAMGDIGSDIAVDAADITLTGDDLSKIPYLKWLSNATVSTIRLGITLSMCINFVAIVLSIMQLLTPTTGALVHNAGSFLVVLMAALLYDRKRPMKTCAKTSKDRSGC